MVAWTKPARVGSRPAMASACWRRAVQMGSTEETFSRGLAMGHFLEGRAFTTKVCRISKRPEPAFYPHRQMGPPPIWGACRTLSRALGGNQEAIGKNTR